MNSFFGGLGNMLFNVTKPTVQTPAQGGAPNLFFQAIGAAMRGEDPHIFMQNLATQHPMLRQYNLNDLQGTAQQICQQNGVNMQDMVNKIDNAANSIMK